MTDWLYRYKNQRLNRDEEAIIKLAYEAKYTDQQTANLLNRPMDTVRRYRARLGLMKYRRRLTVAAFIYCLAALPMAAHDDTDDYSSWYNSLRNEAGVSCCSHNKDCKAVDVYRATSEGYEAFYDGVWVAVPWSAVLQREDNPTGRAVLCIGYRGGEPVARCFVRASES
jgi:hypothetical protein